MNSPNDISFEDYIKSLDQLNVSKYIKLIEQLNDAVYHFKEAIAQYYTQMSSSINGSSIYVKRINSTSNNATRLHFVANAIKYACEEEGDDDFAIKINNFIAMFLGTYAYSIISDAIVDEGNALLDRNYKSNIKRVLHTGLIILKDAQELVTDQEVRGIISDYISTTSSLMANKKSQ